jgi:beta-glucanase (GH16 family)
LNASYSQTSALYDASKCYSLTWGDDFDEPVGTHATGVDLSKWGFGTDDAEGHNGRTAIRSQDPNHLFVKDGLLNFYASYNDSFYYGFQLNSRTHMRFKYGVLEMNAILPHGDGFWVALWATSRDESSPAAFSTEVNVCEMFGNSAVEASNMHGWLKNHRRSYYEEKWAPEGIGEHFSLDVKEYDNLKKYTCPDGKFNNGFHTFTYIWDENTCAFACDGNKYFELNVNEKEVWKETFSQYLYVIISQATGYASQQSCAADNDPAWQESNNFLIDYVHVYQKNDEVHLIKEGSLSH